MDSVELKFPLEPPEQGIAKKKESWRDENGPKKIIKKKIEEGDGWQKKMDGIAERNQASRAWDLFKNWRGGWEMLNGPGGYDEGGREGSCH